MSAEKVYEDAAYFAALLVYLCETKDDETDREIAELLTQKSWLRYVLYGVLQAYAPKRSPSA